MPVVVEFDAGGAVDEAGRKPPREHVGRLDEVVVDGDEE